MKKLIILSLCALMFAPVFAQDDSGGSSSSPGFRFGIKVSPNVSWFRPADKNVMEADGAKMKFSIGLITEFRLAKNYSFATGIDFPSLSGGNILYTGTGISYKLNDSTNFSLKSRSFNLQYVDLPIMLKLKTNEIGYMTYFGQIGGQVGIRTKATAKDESTTAGLKNEDVDVSKDILFIKAALTVGGGAEYNLSGNTSLVFGLQYMYGVTNAFRKESKLLTDVNGAAVAQKANLDQVVLTVGILF